MFKLDLEAFAHADPQQKLEVLAELLRPDLGQGIETIKARLKARQAPKLTAAADDGGGGDGGPGDPNAIITCKLCNDDGFWAGWEWLRALECGSFGLGCPGF